MGIGERGRHDGSRQAHGRQSRSGTSRPGSYKVRRLPGLRIALAALVTAGGVASAQNVSNLSAKLAEIARRPELVHATFGVAAFDLDSKQMVFGLNAEQL